MIISKVIIFILKEKVINKMKYYIFFSFSLF